MKIFIKKFNENAGLSQVEFAENIENRHLSANEIINEFQQEINSVSIFNSYFRTFRTPEELEGTFFMSEFKNYHEIVNEQNFEATEAAQKISTYYEKLNKTIIKSECNSKTYFIDQAKTAKLSYLCEVTFKSAGSNLPEKYQTVVSAQSADVLFQNRKTIYN